jgi:integrase
MGAKVGVNPMRLNNELIGRALKGETAPGKYRDGRNGLLLCVGKSGSASWIMRFMSRGRRHDLGLGPLSHVGLAQARRQAAAKMGALKGEGIDPLEGRAVARQQERLSSMTFGTAAAAYIEANRSAWKDKRAADTWVNSLRDHAGALTNKRVGEITTADVYAVLDPIWATINPTAIRVRGRVEKVLAFAKVRGHRDGSNPAAWKDNLEAMLPKPKAVKRTVKHHAAVPFALMPKVYAKLAASDDPLAALVRFTVLTASRASESKGARWSEISFTARTWTLPGERMKGGRVHVVPLSDEALDLLRSLPRDGDLIFPKCYASDYLVTLRKAADDEAATLHGARSSFDDFGTSNGFADRLIDYSLAHYPQGMTQQAYRREGLLEPRRPLMAAWSNFLLSKTEESALVGMNSTAWRAELEPARKVRGSDRVTIG